MNISKLLWPILGVMLIGTVIMVWTSQGYGKVSPRAYEVSTALYGACLAKSDARLESIENLLDEDADREDTPGVSENERRWLESMIRTARDGDWKSAANSARRMMEDQVEY